ncbi:MAG: alpha-amylase/4-alpha-glucanotransferase domain-containing protein [Endomicrobiaceae bacterium]
MNKVKFIFGVHNHQPIGNFEWVFQKGYDIAYKPFVDVMLKHKTIKWNMHCSGMLWEFFLEKHPSYIKNIKKLILNGNLEILSGGYYEPILSVIPAKDRIGQIKQLSKFIKDILNYECAGAWVAERVWEPSLVESLFDSEIKYTVLDDVHFLSSGLNKNALNGYYLTEDQGKSLKIFPISQRLRYLIPFQDVSVCIEYFKQLAHDNKENIVVMADDGEKFGMWPGTYKHVYENAWLDKFLTALEENSDIVETVTFKDVLKNSKPSGRIYLPTNSYFEMSEWTLPSDVQNNFDMLVKQNENNEDLKPFVRGGFWRNFLTKYEESNNMHKKMIRVSQKIEKDFNSCGKEANKIRQFLYAGQCNCAYWHGVFGGLYLPHLRNAVYEYLLKAENLYNKKVKTKGAWHIVDFDCDGLDEFLYEDKNKNIYVDAACGGTIFEFDIMSKNYNFSNVLTRRYEHYHKKLKEAIENNKVTDSKELTSIHTDAVKVKEIGLENHLSYDWYRKASLIDHFFHNDTKYEDFYPVMFKELGDFVLGEYKAEIIAGRLELSRKGNVWADNFHLPVELKKIITPLKSEGYEVLYKIKNLSDRELNFTFGVENVFAFSQKTVEDMQELKNVKVWTRYDDSLDAYLKIESSARCDFWIVPIETVSTSEDGYERTYQGTSVINIYKFSLKPDNIFSFSLKVNAEVKEK